jgi:hypothetical protein
VYLIGMCFLHQKLLPKKGFPCDLLILTNGNQDWVNFNAVKNFVDKFWSFVAYKKAFNGLFKDTDFKF